MKCPVDGADLMMTDRSGVEIDYCPQCRGVWLDRGELDKIIERSAGSFPPPRRDDDRSRGGYRGDDHHRRDDRDHPRKKRGSLLGEIFDF